MNLEFILAYDHHEEIRALFSEYTDMLVAGEPAFAKYLVKQNYDAEVEHPENKYGLPGGRLYLAYCDKKLAGCFAIRKIDEEYCEIKRLYVRQAFRGIISETKCWTNWFLTLGRSVIKLFFWIHYPF